MKRQGERAKIRLDRPLDAYYEGISERFGIAQVLLYLSLLVFVVLSLISNTRLLTYQNFYYFFRDLGASAETVDVLHTDGLSYPTDASQSFTLYRQGLAVAGETSVTVFTPSGRQVISQKVPVQQSHGGRLRQISAGVRGGRTAVFALQFLCAGPCGEE